MSDSNYLVKIERNGLHAWIEERDGGYVLITHRRTRQSITSTIRWFAGLPEASDALTAVTDAQNTATPIFQPVPAIHNA